MANHGRKIGHLYSSLEDMLDDRPCSLPNHGTSTDSNSIALGITGSPCNPYSTQRRKRFSDGNIAQHSMHGTTSQGVVNFYRKFEPRAGVSEQVMGFLMRTSSDDPITPYSRLGRVTGDLGNQADASEYD